MIKLENTKIVGFEEAVKGVRNIDGSWEKSDSYKTHLEDANSDLTADFEFFLGEEDLKLLIKNRNSVTNCAPKFINVYVDITAPFSWWEEFDKFVGRKNYAACHRHASYYIYNKPFEKDDFSWKELPSDDIPKLMRTIDRLNDYRQYLIKGITVADEKLKREALDKISKNLPNCYNYKKTVMLNYYILAEIYRAKLDTSKEWWSFYKWVEQLPYSKLITFGK